MPNDLVIDVHGINKYFGDKHVVQDVALQVKRGEIYGFLGPNGSGKTTTIRILCGLLTPDSGAGTCLGYDLITQQYMIKQQVGYMTQHFSFYQDLTIEENLNFVAQLYQLPDRPQQVKIAIEKLGLYARRKQLTGTLSGGWKQRLALSACVLHKPALLLLDEPTSGVDPNARRAFWDQIHELSAEGVTTLVSTHYMDEAERCTRLAYIAYGKLLVQGSVREVIAKVGLSSWLITGEDVYRLAPKLKNLPGIEQVTIFGDKLHISGKDSNLIKQTLAQSDFLTGYKVTASKATLEDSFISLVSQTEDNFQ